jgi:hypothetical protein
MDCSQGYLGLYASVKLDMFESVEISRKDPRARSSVMPTSTAIRLQMLSVCWPFELLLLPVRRAPSCPTPVSCPSASPHTDSSTSRVVQ